MDMSRGILPAGKYLTTFMNYLVTPQIKHFLPHLRFPLKSKILIRMKKIGFFLVALFLVIIFLVLQDMDKRLGSLIEISNSNVKNIQKVKVGMLADTLIAIMGMPEKIQQIENNNTSYFYVHFTTDGEYESIRIYVDSAQKIYKIYNPRID